jgi:hypothetical protein
MMEMMPNHIRKKRYGNSFGKSQRKDGGDSDE